MAECPKCPKCPPEGAPEWVMTYGDLMSLLLTFFIMLVAISEIKKEEKFQIVVQHIQLAFGERGGGGKTDNDDSTPALTLPEWLEALMAKMNKHQNKSNTKAEGPDGEDETVTQIRKNFEQVEGGTVVFQRDSAKLNPLAEKQLTQVAENLKGKSNKIKIAANTSHEELKSAEAIKIYPDMDSLCFARARVVKAFLLKLGVEPKRMQIVSNSTNEPVRAGVGGIESQPNRRVEIFASHETVDDFRPHTYEPEVGQ